MGQPLDSTNFPTLYILTDAPGSRGWPALKIRRGGEHFSFLLQHFSSLALVFDFLGISIFCLRCASVLACPLYPLEPLIIVVLNFHPTIPTFLPRLMLPFLSLQIVGVFVVVVVCLLSYNFLTANLVH